MAVIRKLKKMIGPLLGPLVVLMLLVIIKKQNNQRMYKFDQMMSAHSQSNGTGQKEQKLKPGSGAIGGGVHPALSSQSKDVDLIIDITRRPLHEAYVQKKDISRGFINDTDVIEALDSYKFMMRSNGNDSYVTHKYIAGEAEYTRYKHLCDNISYDLTSLPSASVVISFHQNERVESLLHTLHSIYLNSPPELLREIILIDDNSHKASHKEPLASYIDKHFPDGLIKLHRHPGPEQLGLIKGRLLGIKMATGDVAVCMDAHMELQPRWLEPLLQAIHNQRNIMATSHLDWMKPVDEDTTKWTYEHGYHKVKTTWVWKTFNFGFRSTRLEDVNHERFSTRPVESPMSVGTIWAIDRSFFFEIGGFDEEMVLWGGENIDLPIRIHMCSGGRVVNIPCSKAAHQEMRHQRDYRAHWRDHFNKNFKRIAEVWLDGEYKETFDYHNQALRDVDPGDLTERLELRKTCPHNFSYYMEKAFPEMGIDAISFAWRGVINLDNRKCFYYSPDTRIMQMSKCSKEYTKEQAYNNSYKLVRDDYFYEYFRPDKHTTWMHSKDGCIYSPEHGHCLGVIEDGVKLYPCNGTCTSPHMQWKFKKYTHYYKDLWDGNLAKQAEGKIHLSETERKLAKYYEDYTQYLHESGENVTQTAIDNSENSFWRFRLYGKNI